MSHSTTTTQAHILVKYSKSYPSLKKTSPDQGEWQHFINPLIRLVLDIKKSSKNELESVRLRILWSMDARTDGTQMEVDEREVVFEDLDLLSFSSSLTTQQSYQKQNSHGLPLKAVYRDSVVGIRYLHPRLIPSGGTPTFRRFQTTFQTSKAASQFIDSICNVCPCKINPSPTTAPPRTSTLYPNATLTASTPNPIPPNRLSSLSRNLNQTNLLAPSLVRPDTNSALYQTSIETQLPRIPPTSVLQTSVPNPNIPSSSSSNHNLDSPQSPFPHCSSNLDTGSSSRPSSSSSCFVPPNISHSQYLIEPSQQPCQISGPVPERQTSDSSLPIPSLPSSSIPLPAPPSSSLAPALMQKPSDTFIAALRETTGLYGLSRSDLEELVGDVVREEGFVKLLEDLDSMWKVKGFLGR